MRAVSTTPHHGNQAKPLTVRFAVTVVLLLCEAGVFIHAGTLTAATSSTLTSLQQEAWHGAHVMGPAKILH